MKCKLVDSSEIPDLLCYADGLPIAWRSVAPRAKYPVLKLKHDVESTLARGTAQIKLFPKLWIFIFISVAVLTICSCNHPDSANHKTINTTISQAADKHAAELKSSLKIGGTYSFGKDVEKEPVGTVLVYPLTDNCALFYLYVCRGAPSYNSGELFGQMTIIKDNIGTYDSKDDCDDSIDCALKFEFKPEQLYITTDEEHNDCGFGNCVYADHEYHLIDKSIPEYFIDREGYTIFFKDFTAE